MDCRSRLIKLQVCGSRGNRLPGSECLTQAVQQGKLTARCCSCTSKASSTAAFQHTYRQACQALQGQHQSKCQSGTGHCDRWSGTWRQRMVPQPSPGRAGQNQGGLTLAHPSESPGCLPGWLELGMAGAIQPAERIWQQAGCSVPQHREITQPGCCATWLVPGPNLRTAWPALAWALGHCWWPPP